MSILLFNRWDTSKVTVDDIGLNAHINVRPVIVPRSAGKYATMPFHKNDMCIVERFSNKLYVAGHRGKKHKISSGNNVGKSVTLYNEMKKAFEIIEKKTGKNPVQVMVTAIVNSAILEEVASYRLGGIIARQAVVVSPQRRLDLALRYMTQGIYRSSFNNKRPLSSIIADELMAACNNDPKSFAISERKRIEKEAEGAR